MKAIYGILNSEGTHTDVSNTLQGAKKYATLHGYKKVSKRVEYNAYEVANKRRGKWFESRTTLKNVVIYDNGGKTLDRITFVFLNTAEYDIFGTRLNTYECLCTCYTGVSFWSHSYCQRGKHLGSLIGFKDLSENLQKRFENYLLEL